MNSTFLRKLALSAGLVSLTILLASCNLPQPVVTTPTPTPITTGTVTPTDFSAEVDTSLVPQVPSVVDVQGNPQPVAVSQDDEGVQTDFVEGVVLVVGYHSLLDEHDGLKFEFVARNDSLLAPVRGSRAHEVLLWFSQGWYTVHLLDGRLMLSDIRFGELDVDLNNPRVYIFTWELLPDRNRPGEYTFVQVQPEMTNAGAVFRNLIEGIMGRLH